MKGNSVSPSGRLPDISDTRLPGIRDNDNLMLYDIEPAMRQQGSLAMVRTAEDHFCICLYGKSIVLDRADTAKLMQWCLKALTGDGA